MPEIVLVVKKSPMGQNISDAEKELTFYEGEGISESITLDFKKEGRVFLHVPLWALCEAWKEYHNKNFSSGVTKERGQINRQAVNTHRKLIIHSNIVELLRDAGEPVDSKSYLPNLSKIDEVKIKMWTGSD